MAGWFSPKSQSRTSKRSGIKSRYSSAGPQESEKLSPPQAESSWQQQVNHCQIAAADVAAIMSANK